MNIVYIIAGGIAALILFDQLLGFANWFIGVEREIKDIGFDIGNKMWCGGHNSRLRFRRELRGKHLDFVKIAPTVKVFYARQEPTRFFMELDENSCAPAELERAAEALEGKGIERSVERGEDGKISRLTVECDTDQEKAVKAAHAVLVDVYGWDYDSSVRSCHRGGLHALGKTVGWDYKEEDGEHETDRED